MRSTLERLYDVEEAATYLQAHPVTIRRWAREGRLSARRAGIKLVFTEDALEDFLRPVGEPWRKVAMPNRKVPAGGGHE